MQSDDQAGGNGDFWNLLAEAVPEEGAGSEEHAEAVTRALLYLGDADIVAFDGWLRAQLARLEHQLFFALLELPC